MSARSVVMGILAAVVFTTAGYVHASDRVGSLLRDADALRTSDPTKFEQLLRTLNSLQSEATARQREKLAYLDAFATAYAGRYGEAIEEAGKLAATAADVDVRYRSGLLMVNSYAATRQFTEGLRQLQETLGLTQQVEDLETRRQGLGVAAIIYNQVGQYALARDYADQVLSGDASGRTRCYVGMQRLEALLNLRQLPPGGAAIQEVVEQCRREQEPVWANFSRIILARSMAAEGQRTQAIALLRAHAEEAKATRYPRLIGEVESLLSELLLGEGDVEAAEAHAQAAIAQNAGIVNSLPLVVAYRTLYEIADRQKNTAAALKYYRLYAEADRAYLNDVKARELAYQIVSHETLQKTQQISLLNRRNQVLELQQRVDKQSQQNTQLLAAFLGLLVATIGYWAWKMKRVQGSFRRLAETDMLTGISNRHHFTRKAEEALEYCRRNVEDVGLILFDLDHFKSINDRFGHIVGDFVLIRVAEACKASCRKNDRFARIGGEEFAILLVGCDLEATARMAQVFCRQIAAIDTSGSGHEFPVTASFGVTTASRSGYELSRMMSHADQMLYRSKNEGRNQVQVAGDERPYQRVPEGQRELFTITAA